YDEKKKVVKKRAILIGDAASQLKPTTGGGLILGFEVVQIAKKYIKKSLNEDNISILKKYEEIFRKEYSNELRYQIKVQKTLKKLSDDDLDFMFFKLKEKDMDKLISKYGDMDKQSILVKEILKKGLIFSIIPSIIFRQVSKIWNLK
ncbi:MAG: geranylgeranyl reductase, partial [Methanobacteriaceae archaeon]|nr:geranylgeranyl reductase [Candidatus Methanorudis spinitermitis]